MARATSEEIAHGYDRWMLNPIVRRYYGNSDFCNWGYWTPTTLTQKEASEDLVEELLAMIPEKKGRILDVACGMGGSTRQLQRYYAPEDIAALNLSMVQLQRARENAAGSNFQYMDAARLGYQDASFDNIICIEAAFYFDTRDKFFQEAWRVLKPGGRLVQADLAGARFLTNHVPENHVGRLEEFQERLCRAGFEDITIQDATNECLHGFRRSLRRWPIEEFRAGRLGLWQFLRTFILCFAFQFACGRFVRHYTLFSARKPLTDQG